MAPSQLTEIKCVSHSKVVSREFGMFAGEIALSIGGHLIMAVLTAEVAPFDGASSNPVSLYRGAGSPQKRQLNSASSGEGCDLGDFSVWVVSR